jgi:hypothetical protein
MIVFESEDEVRIWTSVYTAVLTNSLLLPSSTYSGFADLAVRDFRARLAVDEPVKANEVIPEALKKTVKES